MLNIHLVIRASHNNCPTYMASYKGRLMREIFSRKMVQRSPFVVGETARCNTTGRFAELATNVKHSSSYTSFAQ